jgi:general secretion pathway protein K
MKLQRGVALLVVLWVLALLSLLLASLAGGVRLESRQALWQRQHTQGLLAAEAGMNLAVMGLLERNPSVRWRADGQPHSLEFDNAHVQVSVFSERGKLDLNIAASADFGRLLKAVGASSSQAADLEHALDQRRGGLRPPLRLLEEMRELPGMTEPLYTALSSDVTLWSGLESPSAAFASPRLRQVFGLGHAPGQGITDVSDPGDILTLYSQARLADGFTSALSVTLLLTASKEGTRPYRVLRWQE